MLSVGVVVVIFQVGGWLTFTCCPCQDFDTGIPGVSGHSTVVVRTSDSSATTGSEAFPTSNELLSWWVVCVSGFEQCWDSGNSWDI